MWQLPKPDDLAVVCYTSGTTGTCHCITDFDVDPNVHLQRCQLLEILSLENFPFAALCPAITAHPTPNTHKSTYPQILMSVLLMTLSLNFMTLSFCDSNAAHLIITFIVSDEIMPPETVSHTMVLRRKIIVGFWGNFLG